MKEETRAEVKAVENEAKAETNYDAEVKEAKETTKVAVKENADVAKATGKGIFKIIRALFKKDK